MKWKKIWIAKLRIPDELFSFALNVDQIMNMDQ